MEILKMYHNPKYTVDETEQDCIVSYIEGNGIYLTTEDDTFKIIQKPTFELDSDNIDQYVESRGFEKMLEFDKTTITWFNGYDSDESKAYLKTKIPYIRSNIYNKLLNRAVPSSTLSVIYIHLSLLQTSM